MVIIFTYYDKQTMSYAKIYVLKPVLKLKLVLYTIVDYEERLKICFRTASRFSLLPTRGKNPKYTPVV
jgi:hypothetical protein